MRIAPIVAALVLVTALSGCGNEDSASSCATSELRPINTKSLSAADAIKLASSEGALWTAWAEVDGEVPGHRAGDLWNVVAVALDDGSVPVFAEATEPLVVGRGQAFGRSALNDDAEALGWGTQPDVVEALSDKVQPAIDCAEAAGDPKPAVTHEHEAQDLGDLLCSADDDSVDDLYEAHTREEYGKHFTDETDGELREQVVRAMRETCGSAPAALAVDR